MSEPPEILFQLIRVAWKECDGASRMEIRRGIDGRWAARVGNTVIVSPGPRHDGWTVEKYPPPKLPLSSDVLEVSK